MIFVVAYAAAHLAQRCHLAGSVAALAACSEDLCRHEGVEGSGQALFQAVDVDRLRDLPKLRSPLSLKEERAFACQRSPSLARTLASARRT